MRVGHIRDQKLSLNMLEVPVGHSSGDVGLTVELMSIEINSGLLGYF